ncbi:MAG: AMP-binding protein [Clostridia bacterium]|nr:AMP-binding protein [Clostridia bacterium]
MLLEKIRFNLENNKDKLCYLSKSNRYTYKDLDEMVRKIYKYILDKNVTGRVVCVGHKEIEILAAFLACSFAGITYIPIDESIPQERLEYIINDTKPMLVLTKDIITDIINEELIEDVELNIKIKAEDVYYIIYTSGSTGKPKGVEITYENLESFVSWFVTVIPKESVRVLNQALFSFDLSVADIYFSLYTASTLCITETSFMENAVELYNEIKSLNVDVTIMTPSYANLLLTDKCFNKELVPNLDIMYFCGETLTRKTIDRLKERFEGVKIINSYGPTECTVAISSVDVTNIKEKVLPVGIIKPDVEVHILDEDMQETADVGEIVIVGNSVGKGYLNINTDSFFNYNGKYAYKTGDIGYIKDGMLYFESRKDSQIKYLGHRIELEDITNNILNVDDVENVITFTKKNEEMVVTKIISCVKLKQESKAGAKEITKVLREKLPNYMVPKIKIVDEFMLNANGKIDKKQMEEIFNER